MFNYYLNDNISFQLIGGLPPEVDIKGKGEIVAHFSGTATPDAALGSLFPGGELDLQKDIPITDLGSKSKVASVRAWTPRWKSSTSSTRPA